MSWGKVDDRLHSHSKARRAREAMALWVLALSWCCSELTDGLVPSDMPELLIPGGDAMAERLVSVGLWERVEGGFRFHDWRDFQPSADEVKARREAISRARSEAGKRGNEKRWGGRSQTSQNDRNVIANDSQESSQTHRNVIANASQTGSQNDRPVPVPVPEDSLRSSSARETPLSETAKAAWDALDEIERGAAEGHRPGAWDHRGDARTVAALSRALTALQRSKEEMRDLGRYLASKEASEKYKTQRFTPRSFVYFGPGGVIDAGPVERLCNDAAEWAARQRARVVTIDPAHLPAVRKPEPPRLSLEEARELRREWEAKHGPILGRKASSDDE